MISCSMIKKENSSNGWRYLPHCTEVSSFPPIRPFLIKKSQESVSQILAEIALHQAYKVRITGD